MDLLNEALKNPFTWGLLLGLLVAAFLWKSGFSARRNVARDLVRVEAELKNLQNHWLPDWPGYSGRLGTICGDVGPND